MCSSNLPLASTLRGLERLVDISLSAARLRSRVSPGIASGVLPERLFGGEEGLRKRPSFFVEECCILFSLVELEMDKRAAQLDAWMRRPDWLRGAARVRVEEAHRYPVHSMEHCRQMEIAARYEQEAAEGSDGCE